MAAALVGEAVLSASVELLVDRISSSDFLDFFRSKKLDVSLLKKLKTVLLTLQAVLNDAEEKQITNPAVREWLDDLNDALYDADDLLDEINTQALRCTVEAMSQSQTFTDQVRNCLSSPFKRFKGATNSEIQTLFERLEQFALQKDILGFKEGVSSRVWHGRSTSSVVDETVIYGRDNDIGKLKDYLMSEDDSGSGSKIGVVAIVGMGGLGKTTLAKLLYNDHEVKKQFDLKGWAHISKEFDLCRVTKSLLESVNSKSVVTDNLNTLQVELQQRLSRRRFLLVLDDIWDGSYDDWTKLKAIFNAGEMGSKIIITTRDESVARTMKTFLPIYYLRSLQSEDCWSLLATHAFGSNNGNKHSNLEVIGKEIAKKCGGLPLAAKAIGGLLRTKLTEKEWNKVLKSNIWDLPNVGVLPALLLSYHYLPANLKRCFAYCSVFPKNFWIENKMVVQLWIAEGLVRQSTSEKTVEEVGDEYLAELASRSLIRQFPASIYQTAWFMMHDLINDLATMVSSAFCIRYEHTKMLGSLERIRHLSYTRGTNDYYNKFHTFYEAKGLRTFIALQLKPISVWESYYLSKKVVQNLLPAMRKLRVLSLSWYSNINELPDSVLENLIHLRYLDLSNTKIERLPNATCKLYNLQTLLLSNCKRLTDLPMDMENLVNLRNLDISGTKLKDMPVQIAGLKNLQTLSTFIVSKQQGGLKIGELRKFPCLQGKLSIIKLQNVVDPSDAFQANLKKKEQIEELSLEWDCSSTEDPEIERRVLEQLQPSTYLKKLCIESYGGTSFPNWLVDSSFGNMVYLRISGCDNCRSLPPLGQVHSLKKLIISGFKSVKTVGSEFYGSSSPSFQPFPSLTNLSFEEMPEWEEWNMTGGISITAEFPSLKYLYLKDCPKLKGNVPSNLHSLLYLELFKCPLLEAGHSDKVHKTNSNIMMPSDLFNKLMMGLNSLQRLIISGIHFLTSFPRDGLPRTLKYHRLQDCEKLEFLPLESLHSYRSLEDLGIANSCCSLTSFPLGSLPVLKTLSIWDCKNLKSISIAEDASQSLSFLQRFSISNCPELESFPQGGLPTPNLIDLAVCYCGKLTSLPEPVHTLAGLQELTTFDLPKLQSFAEEGLPINLQRLRLGNHEGIFSNTAITKWGLEQLTCLSELQIRGDNLVNTLMKMDVPLLSTSLVSLRIYDLHDTTYLDGKWLQHLTSLENLEISYSPSLELLPEERLPSSVLVFTIMCCDLLKANCQTNGGKEWPKIDHIPCIIIDEEVII